MWRIRGEIYYSIIIPNNFQNWQQKAPTFDTAPPTIAALGQYF